MSHPKNARTKVSLIIFGDRVIPDEWALYFQRSPDEWAFRDEPVVGDRHFRGPRIATETFAAYISANPRWVTIDQQVTALKEILQFPRPDFSARILSADVSVRLIIDVDNYRGDNPPVYGAPTESFLAETSAILDLQIVDQDSLARSDHAESERSPDYQRTRASLAIRGDHVVPERWALYFNLRPQSFARKGEFGLHSNGRVASVPSPHGHVSFACDGSKSLLIDEQTQALRSMLGFPREDFLTCLAREGSRAEIWIFVDNDDGTNPPVYGAPTSDFVAEINAELILDVYPDAFEFITFIDDD